MCASCGCGVVNDDHGNPANITMKDLDQAAAAAGVSTEKVAQNITSCC
jgi:hypothetical protein